MRRTIIGLGIGLFGIVLVFPLISHGQYGGGDPTTDYEAGPTPTLGEIQHECVLDDPAPKSRTTIGIGEAMHCWIDPSTWSDTDIYIGPGGPYPVSDPIGTTTWTVSGGGTVTPSVGTDVTYQSDLADQDEAVTITATTQDSKKKGADAPVQKNLQVGVKAPTGVVYALLNDITNYGGVVGPPNNQIGAESKFLLAVTPNTVNYQNVDFRENIPQQTINWTDGTNEVVFNGGEVDAFNVSVQNGLNNVAQDTVSSALRPIARIAAQKFSYVINDPMEYSDSQGTWKNFVTVKSTKEFTNTGQARVSGSNQFGGLEGPWQ